jgi:hypothetical protein
VFAFSGYWRKKIRDIGRWSRGTGRWSTGTGRWGRGTRRGEGFIYHLFKYSTAIGVI